MSKRLEELLDALEQLEENSKEAKDIKEEIDNILNAQSETPNVNKSAKDFLREFGFDPDLMKED